MLKGVINRDNGNIVNEHITFYGGVINNGIEFKLIPLKISKDKYKLTNTSHKDPFVAYIRELFKLNKFKTVNLKIIHLSNDSWEVEIND